MMTKYETGKLSAKGVVAIPVKVRKILGVEEGDKLEFELEGERLIVRGVKQVSIWDVFGSMKLDKPLVDVKELRDQYREGLIADDLQRRKNLEE
ncbi:AbrB/MazE/SpoVT family DNA-binding domain-containing protein [Cohnella suwonensis]|uniref:AbrB/MazE/SpoVT family DNA-binding domain-containing protein n=1 Tax=Cohnella suwonensis TaxID=696072 RepID=A0ABW0LYC8_9BACL